MQFLRSCLYKMIPFEDVAFSRCFEVSTERIPPLLCICRAYHGHTPERFLSSRFIIQLILVWYQIFLVDKLQHFKPKLHPSVFHAFLIPLTLVPKLTTPSRNQGSSWSLLGSIRPFESTRLRKRGPPESPWKKHMMHVHNQIDCSPCMNLCHDRRLRRPEIFQG